MADQDSPPARAPRGFAAMDRQRQREIASQGGKAAHRSGRAHQFTAQEARAARAISHASRRAAQQNASGERRAQPDSDVDAVKQEETAES
ncbi:KGG domain-containing protein [Pigmentiphaga litoralis]|uniref:KGG domain-containing protein n=1 Tax=Pigmentiphaga litoralis TaxID=516702 RepID=UPI003B42E9B8